jgi:hypothetical protein
VLELSSTSDTLVTKAASPVKGSLSPNMKKEKNVKLIETKKALKAVEQTLLSRASRTQSTARSFSSASGNIAVNASSIAHFLKKGTSLLISLHLLFILLDLFLYIHK